MVGLTLSSRITRLMLTVSVAVSSASLSAQKFDNAEQLIGATGLSGWQQVSGTWHAEKGAIVGSAANGGALLKSQRGWEDLELDVDYRCQGCEAGVLVRQADQREHAGQTTGLYIGIAGPGSPTLSRVTLDAQGKVLQKKEIASRVDPGGINDFAGLSIYSTRNRDGHYFMVKDMPDGSKRMHILLRGDLVPAIALAQGSTFPKSELEEPKYGSVALHVGKGEATFTKIVLRDLERPTMGLPDRKVGAGFKAIELTDRFYSEGITAADINHDGKMDIVSGPFAYLGPDFHKSIEIFDPKPYVWAGAGQAGTYTDSFLEYLYDFTGDGWPDLLKINFNGGYLYVNPKNESRHWEVHDVLGPVSSENTQLCDLDGDGKMEFLMSQGADPKRVEGFAKFDPADATKKWTFYPVSTPGSWSGHGMGCGDINTDGKMDFLQGAGWWEQPAAGATSGLWKFHENPWGVGPDAFKRGADLLVYDVNKDGLPDVISSYFAHGPGLAWFKQERNGSEIKLVPQLIMDDPGTPMAERKNWLETDKSVAFTELHALALVDMDGDGLPDIVTGKRWWSHGIEFPENDMDDQAVMYWFKMIRQPGGKVVFEPHLINNYSGVGTQIFVTDVNGDGRPDVMTAQRKGAYVFLNTGSGAAKKAAATK